MSTKTAAQRITERAERQPSGCLHWTGYIGNHGYGVLGVNGKNRLVHRLAFEMANGPIPAGRLVCHRCDNRRCMEPEHLFLGSIADNNADMRAKGRGVTLFGSRNGRARITESDVVAIRAASGTSDVVAARFGVSPSTIRHIRQGKQWKHVP